VVVEVEGVNGTAFELSFLLGDLDGFYISALDHDLMDHPHNGSSLNWTTFAHHLRHPPKSSLYMDSLRPITACLNSTSCDGFSFNGRKLQWLLPAPAHKIFIPWRMRIPTDTSRHLLSDWSIPYNSTYVIVWNNGIASPSQDLLDVDLGTPQQGASFLVTTAISFVFGSMLVGLGACMVGPKKAMVVET